MRLLLNIIWLVLAGLWMAIGNVVWLIVCDIVPVDAGAPFAR